MRCLCPFALLLILAVPSVGRPYFNNQEAPESLRDLKNIQKALQESLTKTRAATVCLEIGEGSGSGVIISEDGLVLTAAHVSGGVDQDIVVVMEDGRKLRGISLGLNSETDAAMLQITDPGPFPFVELDEDDSFKLGDWVFALGHSGGFDKERGINVRVGRLVRQADSTVQSDCLLIGGDSGGPLFDIEGKLIAIHSRVGGSKEESMHVPIREFQRGWEEMSEGKFMGEGGFAKKPVPGSAFLGVVLEEKEGGALEVREIYPESIADTTGIKVGAILLELNGEVVSGESSFFEALDKKGVGESVVIKWSYQEEVIEKKIKLGARP
ncbi:MAG: S1C family serine protease [Akkermansiaceae bacterium]